MQEDFYYYDVEIYERQNPLNNTQKTYKDILYFES